MLGLNINVNIFAFVYNKVSFAFRPQVYGAFFLRMFFNLISILGLINLHPGAFLCCEIYTVVRVDSSHCLRIKFIYSIGRKRVFINVGREITYEDSHL